MLDNCKLSIIIPAFNCESTLNRALNSIPKRDDIELIIIDDCSTDNTRCVINNWKLDNSKNFYSIVTKYMEINSGVGICEDIGYSLASGEYLITLDSDDYFLPDFIKVINYIYSNDSNNYDLIFISNSINDGSIWSGSDRKATWSYLVKKSYLNTLGLTYPHMRRAGDYVLTESIMKFNPRIILTGILAYHYNYPREGSIVWNHQHGLD